jgi:hypothetical protein
VHCTALNPNGRVLEDILASDLDLCVLNDSTPTYFEDDREYTQVLDLMLCSSNLADKVIDASVLLDWRLSSDHAPVVCNLAIDYLPRIELNKNDLRFNLSRADWSQFGRAIDEAIGK